MKTSLLFKTIAISIILITVFAMAGVLFEANADAIGKNPSTVTASTAATDKVDDIGSKIIGIVTTVASFASVGILVVLGIKYMMGSTEEKAEYKKTLLPYVIGAVFVFGASTIAGYLYNVASGL